MFLGTFVNGLSFYSKLSQMLPITTLLLSGIQELNQT